MAPTGRGQGRRSGRRRGGNESDEGELSPEWLPPRQRRELEARGAPQTPTREGGRARRRGGSRERVSPGGGAGRSEGAGGGGNQCHGLLSTASKEMCGLLGVGGPLEQMEGKTSLQVWWGMRHQTWEHNHHPISHHLPSMDELNNTLVPTLKWCPKAARGEFARELASLWNRLNENPEDVKLWTLEFMFARCILPAGRGPRAGDAYSMARLVRERLRRWRAGEYSILWQEAVDLTKVPKKKGRNRKGEEEKSQEKRNAERATVLAQDGQYTKALQALTSAGMATPSSANLKVREGFKNPSYGKIPLWGRGGGTPLFR